jgi:hypothetical protein
VVEHLPSKNEALSSKPYYLQKKKKEERKVELKGSYVWEKVEESRDE